MIKMGRLQGEVAERWPSHCYRLPITKDLSVWDYTPDRVFPDKEYPKFSGIVIEELKTISCLDYYIEIASIPDSLFQSLKVVLRPNKLTMSDKRWCIHEAKVGFGMKYAYSQKCEVIDEVFKRIFK